MKSIYKTKNILLIVSLLLTIGLPCGVLLIIFGFSKGMIFMAIVGIILAACGFYIMPLLWIKFGSSCFYCTLYNIIINEQLRSVTIISQSTSKNRNDIINAVKYLTSNRYLVGFMLVENEYIVEINKDENYRKSAEVMSGILVSRKCPMCGATSQLPKTSAECPYCKYIMNEDENYN